MSTSQTPSSTSDSGEPRGPSRECQHPDCDEVAPKWELHHGKYCSNRCETRHAGRQELARYRYDHTRCYTCFRELKTILEPKPDFEFTERGHGWTRNADGEITLEYYSQEVTRSAACGTQFLTPNAGKGEKQRGEQVVTGTICARCGNTDHREHLPVIASPAAIGRLASLLEARDDIVIDVETLHRAYRETRDLEYAVGSALQE